MTATLDYLALLTAIRDNPGEDVPRLMLADELEDTDPARAELIRVQCELARHPHGPDVLARNYDARDGLSGEWAAAFALAQRADIIIAVNGNRWRKGPECAWCDGRGFHDLVVYAHTDHRGELAGRVECRVCYSTGDAGGLLRQFDYDTRPGTSTRSMEPAPVHYRRGFIERVDVPTLEELVRDCPDCMGGRWANGRDGQCRTCGDALAVPIPWLRAVLTATPERALIREVVPLDREPYHNGAGWCWYNGSNLPTVIYRHVADAHKYGGQWVPSPTREAAIAALGRAVVTWAREAG